MSAETQAQLLDVERRLHSLETLESADNGIYAEFMQLPVLRFFVPLSSVDDTGMAYDVSGQARHFTYNGNPTYNVYSSATGTFAPYIDLDGTGDFLSRADEAGLDILGTEASVATGVKGLTIGGWFWFDSVTGTRGVFGKWNDVGVNQRSYVIFMSGATPVFYMSSNGTAAAGITGANLSTGAWYFLVGRFNPSTEIALFVNTVKTTVTAAVPAAIFNSTSSAKMPAGDVGGATNYFDGRGALLWLCASLVSDSQIARIYHATRHLFDV